MKSQNLFAMTKCPTLDMFKLSNVYYCNYGEMIIYYNGHKI